MSVQTKYTFSSPVGLAGGIVDISPHAVESRTNEQPAEGPAMKFGMGVVTGSKPGVYVAIPGENDEVSSFEGITVNGFTKQHDLEGVISITSAETVGVMSWGKIWARLADGVSPSFGDDVYLIRKGAEAGTFTNVDSGAGDEIMIPARFMSGRGTGNIAQVELFNQKKD